MLSAAALPHRFPMAFIDSVVTMDGENIHATSGRACAGFHRDDATFTAPLEDPDAWPRALVLEAWCQAAALLLLSDSPPPGPAPAVLISRLATVRHYGDVRLGDTIDLHVRCTDRYPAATAFTGYARCGERRLLDVERLTATARPFPELTGGTRG